LKSISEEAMKMVEEMELLNQEAENEEIIIDQESKEDVFG